MEFIGACVLVGNVSKKLPCSNIGQPKAGAYGVHFRLTRVFTRVNSRIHVEMQTNTHTLAFLVPTHRGQVVVLETFSVQPL